MKIVINETKNNEVKAILYRDDGVIEIEGPKISCFNDFMVNANAAFNALRLDYNKRDLRDFLKTGIFGKMRSDDSYKYFVVVADKLVYNTGGFDYIEGLNKNLQFPLPCNEIVEIYTSEVISFDQARRCSDAGIDAGIDAFVWKR